MKPIPTKYFDLFEDNYYFLLFRDAMMKDIEEAELNAWVAEFKMGAKP